MRTKFSPTRNYLILTLKEVFVSAVHFLQKIHNKTCHFVTFFSISLTFGSFRRLFFVILYVFFPFCHPIFNSQSKIVNPTPPFLAQNQALQLTKNPHNFIRKNTPKYSPKPINFLDLTNNNLI